MLSFTHTRVIFVGTFLLLLVLFRCSGSSGLSQTVYVTQSALSQPVKKERHPIPPQLHAFVSLLPAERRASIRAELSELKKNMPSESSEGDEPSRPTHPPGPPGPGRPPQHSEICSEEGSVPMMSFYQVLGECAPLVLWGRMNGSHHRRHHNGSFPPGPHHPHHPPSEGSENARREEIAPTTEEDPMDLKNIPWVRMDLVEGRGGGGGGPGGDGDGGHRGPPQNSRRSGDAPKDGESGDKEGRQKQREERQKQKGTHVRVRVVGYKTADACKLAVAGSEIFTRMQMAPLDCVSMRGPMGPEGKHEGKPEGEGEGKDKMNREAPAPKEDSAAMKMDKYTWFSTWASDHSDESDDFVSFAVYDSNDCGGSVLSAGTVRAKALQIPSSSEDSQGADIGSVCSTLAGISIGEHQCYPVDDGQSLYVGCAVQNWHSYDSTAVGLGVGISVGVIGLCCVCALIITLTCVVVQCLKCRRRRRKASGFSSLNIQESEEDVSSAAPVLELGDGQLVVGDAFNATERDAVEKGYNLI